MNICLHLVTACFLSLFLANVCKGAADGDYIDVHNPYGYITCVGGQTFRKNCSPGMKWDNISKSCVRQFK